KAIAYGIPGVQVDGNDVFAVYQAAREAAERARSGGGATLIEAVTYRMGPHTTADDPDRYRDSEEAAEWSKRDPLERVRIYLSERDRWTEEWQADVESRTFDEVERAIELAESLYEPDPLHLFDAVFESLPPTLERQRDELEALLGEDGD